MAHAGRAARLVAFAPLGVVLAHGTWTFARQARRRADVALESRLRRGLHARPRGTPRRSAAATTPPSPTTPSSSPTTRPSTSPSSPWGRSCSGRRSSSRASWPFSRHSCCWPCSSPRFAGCSGRWRRRSPSRCLFVMPWFVTTWAALARVDTTAIAPLARGPVDRGAPGPEAEPGRRSPTAGWRSSPSRPQSWPPRPCSSISPSRGTGASSVPSSRTPRRSARSSACSCSRPTVARGVTSSSTPRPASYEWGRMAESYLQLAVDRRTACCSHGGEPRDGGLRAAGEERGASCSSTSG